LLSYKLKSDGPDFTSALSGISLPEKLKRFIQQSSEIQLFKFIKTYSLMTPMEEKSSMDTIQIKAKEKVKELEEI